MNDDVENTIEDWLKIIDEASYYELLGVLEIESQDGIREAFHRFSQSFHPDRHRAAPPSIREAATHIYKRGAEAYGVLRDEKKRALYDVGLAQGNLRYQTNRSIETAHAAPRYNLVELARTKAAKLHARQAERAIAEKRLIDAENLVEKALLVDDGNEELEQGALALIDLVRRGEILPS